MKASKEVSDWYVQSIIEYRQMSNGLEIKADLCEDPKGLLVSNSEFIVSLENTGSYLVKPALVDGLYELSTITDNGSKIRSLADRDNVLVWKKLAREKPQKSIYQRVYDCLGNTLI